MILVGSVESSLAGQIKTASQADSTVVALNSAAAIELEELGISCIPLIQDGRLSSWASVNRGLQILGESFTRECLNREGEDRDPEISVALRVWMPTLLSSVNRHFVLTAALREIINRCTPREVLIVMTKRQEEEEYAPLLDFLLYQGIPFSRGL